MSEEEAKCEMKGCGTSITNENVIAYSKEHFGGKTFCWDCQQKLKDNPGWVYDPSKKESESKKGSFDKFFARDAGDAVDADLESFGAENDAELDEELRAEFDGILQGFSSENKDGVYSWLKSEYGKDSFSELSLELKRKVIAEMKQGKEAIENEEHIYEFEQEDKEKFITLWSKCVEIDEGAFSFREVGGNLQCKCDDEGEVCELDISIPTCSCAAFQKDKSELCPHLKAAVVIGYIVKELSKVPATSEVAKSKKPKKRSKPKKVENAATGTESKYIPIDWNNIPEQILVPKLVKALEYVAEEGTDFFAVLKHSGDGADHRAMLQGSCDCGDFIYRGTSLNPCVHQVRIKYTDEEIHAKLKEFGIDSVEDYKVKHMPAKTAIVPVSRNKPDIVSPQIKTMMIKQLTPRLAEVGKIKIGGKSDTASSKGYLLPEKWDHFEIATLLKDDEGRLIMDDEINKRIGKDCKSLDISLCYDEPALNVPSFYARFSKSKLLCMGNGECAKELNDKGERDNVVCNPRSCGEYIANRCRPYGRLSVILEASNRIGGVHIFRTTSWHSIQNLLSSMALISLKSGGILAGIPLRMSLLPMTVAPEGVGRNVNIYVVNLEFVGSTEELHKASEREVERRVTLGINRRKMEAVDSEVIATQVVREAEEQAEEIAAEFVPDGE